MAKDKKPPLAKKSATAKKSVVRRKVLKDKNAPKRPTSGYFVYLAERRPLFNKEHENDAQKFSNVAAVNGALAAEWRELSADQKKVYNEKAEKDRERYKREMELYKKSDEFKKFQSQKEKLVNKRSRDEQFGGNEDRLKAGDIPIFSQKFLDHNKEREALLRKIRKDCSQLEEESRCLKKYLESVEVSTRGVEEEVDLLKQKDKEQSDKLLRWQKTIIDAFKSCPLPGTKEPPSMKTLDAYITKISQMKKNGHSSTFEDKLRKIASKLTFG